MEKSSLMIALLSVMVVKSVNAQIDSPRPGAGAHQPPTCQDPPKKATRLKEYRKSDLVLIQSSKIPKKLRVTLSTSDKFMGWEHVQVYYERTRKQYSLTLAEGSGSHNYIFSENGTQLTENDQ